MYAKSRQKSRKAEQQFREKCVNSQALRFWRCAASGHESVAIYAVYSLRLLYNPVSSNRLSPSAFERLNFRARCNSSLAFPSVPRPSRLEPDVTPTPAAISAKLCAAPKRVRPFATTLIPSGALYPTVSIPDLAALMRVLSPSTSTHAHSSRARIRQLAPRGGRRDC
ncbi:hypothetical protein EDB86DRAFT_2259346 [Lactarius hatsudake]|nr:hypothetical protein EDB86DRAFT_2259346 [Lactarius hatsudake]